MEAKLEVGQVLSGVAEMLRANIATALIAVVGLVAVNIGLDHFGSASGNTAGSGIASLVAQYVVIRRALEQSGRIPPGTKPRLGAFWGLNLLSGIGILLGYVLLIVPGLYLAARWMAPALSCWPRTRPSARRSVEAGR